MKESYGEGLATHAGPESCAFDRKVEGEALTGGSVSRAIEPRNALLPGACAVRRCVGHVGRIGIMARSSLTWRGRGTCAYVDASHTESGRPHVRPDRDGDPVRAVNPKGALQR